jgi:Xaa-Pro aminopeptidase
MTKPGLYEYEVAGAVEGKVLSSGSYVSFPIIFSIHGEVLHGHSHENVMKDGDLLILDCGAESPLYYASDITRTYPVNGKFSGIQKDIYQIVLAANVEAIKMIRPRIPFRDVHIHAAKTIADGLQQLGFMKGDTDEAVAAGAHALFFPHGLGHHLGLDVHDMENFGEDYVGYDDDIKRSDQFGLAYLRLAKKLQPGYVVTVEPGIYFMPELFAQWKSQKKCAGFIDYKKVESHLGLCGFRVEDDVLVTKDGYRVLGNPIAKTVEEVEEWCG